MSTTPRKRRQPQAAAERSELLDHLQALLEPLMAALGLVFLVLLLVEFADPGLGAGQRAWLNRATTAIWLVFLVEFAVRFALAPAKLRHLRDNWLGAISLALPFLRPLRALRALRVVRSLSLVRLLGGVNRGMRLLRRVTRGRQLAYVAALTVFVVLAGAAGVLYFDRGVAGAPIQSLGDALWWSAALVTTVNSEKYVVSPEARVIAILQRLFAVSVFGLVTAAIASYFVGRDAEARSGGDGGDEALDLRGELAGLRRDGEAVRRELAATQEMLGRLLAISTGEGGHAVRDGAGTDSVGKSRAAGSEGVVPQAPPREG